MSEINTKTRILEASPESIAECALLIQQGKLVAIPTETVYGLGANALDEQACRSIFTTKGRPLTDPLIVHVHSLQQALSLIEQNNQSSNAILHIFQILANSYWPGPLTLVVKANLDLIPKVITADTGYVGLRMPNHEIALELLRKSNCPIAAPSANKFGHVSPSKAQHVYDDFYKDSEVTVLDGGQCSFGIESTVLKIDELSDKSILLTILRKGGVSEKSLSETILTQDELKQLQISIISKKHNEFKEETENLEGPGQFLRHYAPYIESYLFQGEFQTKQSNFELKDSILIDFCGSQSKLRDQVKYYIDISEKGSYTEAINQLYEILRWAETREDAKAVLITNINQQSIVDFIKQKNDGDSKYLVEGEEHKDALFDRIFRATSGRII